MSHLFISFEFFSAICIESFNLGRYALQKVSSGTHSISIKMVVASLVVLTVKRLQCVLLGKSVEKDNMFFYINACSCLYINK